MSWSPQQEAALKSAKAWLRAKDAPQVFRIFGWAGTGKSTLAVALGDEVRKVCYAAFTGKAALVMRKKGCRGASTIHQLIYQLESEKGGQPQFMVNMESELADADLLVIDEVSMVDDILAHDLLGFGVKVLVLGDPFQLPPVKGTGYFTENVTPDVMLTEIHRQAAGNPIIHLSMDIRNGKALDYGVFGDTKIIRRKEVDQAEVLAADQIIVGRNITRVNYNNRVRELLGRPPLEPCVGDRLICLRNNRQKKFMNGQLFEVEEVMPQSRGSQRIKMHVTPVDAGRRKATAIVDTHRSFFLGTEEEMAWEDRRKYDEFTFGYAITCHKAQGSQWDHVYLFDESRAFRRDADRWLYTATTRAAEKITIVR